MPFFRDSCFRVFVIEFRSSMMPRYGFFAFSRGMSGTRRRCRLLGRNPHGVERTPDEHKGDEQEPGADNVRTEAAAGLAHLDGDLDGQQAEEGRELDDRV